MIKVEIINKDTQRYFQRFEPNETYVAQKRGIGTNVFDASEFTSIWSPDPKAFDTRSAGGILKELCEEFSWNKRDERVIELRFFNTDANWGDTV